MWWFKWSTPYDLEAHDVGIKAHVQSGGSSFRGNLKESEGEKKTTLEDDKEE